VGRSSLGPFTIAGFSISGVECVSPATRQLV
jgi:hypothetical protein